MISAGSGISGFSAASGRRRVVMATSITAR
jgi:hypothetical protein